MTLFQKGIRKIRRTFELDRRFNEPVLRRLFKDKEGIEIGGPSAIFSAEFPVYKFVKNVDGCNFSTSTVWEGTISEGNNYNYYKDKKGYQFICEASDLRQVPSGKYDFLLASHCLEHCANVLKTMQEWTRVVKPGGYIVLILPAPKYTFDHNRPVTSFEHLKADLEKNVNETDMTHLDEIIKLHDLALDPLAGGAENFKARSLKNFENRCLHHHVFDFELMQQIFSYHHLQTVLKKFIPPFHQILVGQKPEN